MSVQDRISPYNIDTISSKQVMRILKKYQLQDYKLIQYQILQTNIIRTVWQTERRITHEILGVKGWIHCRLVLLYLKFIYEGLSLHLFFKMSPKCMKFVFGTMYLHVHEMLKNPVCIWNLQQGLYPFSEEFFRT